MKAFCIHSIRVDKKKINIICYDIFKLSKSSLHEKISAHIPGPSSEAQCWWLVFVVPRNTSCLLFHTVLIIFLCSTQYCIRSSSTMLPNNHKNQSPRLQTEPSSWSLRLFLLDILLLGCEIDCFVKVSLVVSWCVFFTREKVVLISFIDQNFQLRHVSGSLIVQGCFK